MRVRQQAGSGMRLMSTRAPPQRLDGDSRSAALADVTGRGWTMVEGRDAIFKKFEFSDFNQAFAFMAHSALVAEKLDHHPEVQQRLSPPSNTTS